MDTYHVAEHSQWWRFWRLKELLEKTVADTLTLRAIPDHTEPTRWSPQLLATFRLLVKNFPLYAQTKLQTNCWDVPVPWTLYSLQQERCWQFPTKAQLSRKVDVMSRTSSNGEQNRAQRCCLHITSQRVAEFKNVSSTSHPRILVYLLATLVSEILYVVRLTYSFTTTNYCTLEFNYKNKNNI